MARIRQFITFPARTMDFACALLAAVLFLPMVAHAGPAELPVDPRPFGKFLAGVCVLPNQCNFVPTGARAAPKPPKITIEQVGCAPGAASCPDPVYPLSGDFYIRATSSDGQPVDQQVLAGQATTADMGSTRHYTLNGSGTVIIRASMAAPVQTQAVPAELVLGTKSASDQTCGGLLPGPSAAKQNQIGAQDIVTLIGSPTPFVLAAQSSDTIFIYSTRSGPNHADRVELAALFAQIEEFSTQTPSALNISPAPGSFTVELSILHAAALGDLASRISALNYADFTLKNIGGDAVRITASKQPSCETWKAFLSAVRRIQWSVAPEPFDLKLFYLNSTDAVKAFSDLAAGSSAGGGGSPAAGGGGSPSGGAGGTSGGGSAASAADATISVTQPPGSVVEVKSNTTPCVVAGLAMSNSTACAPAGGAAGSSGSGSSPAASGGSSSSAKPAPIGMASMAVAAGDSEQTFSDLLVFSDANPGDDALVTERKRILAQLDLPRPEMLVNAWVMQNSTPDPRAIGKFANQVKDLVASYNEAVENVVLKGWASIMRQHDEPTYFNQSFYHYVADHYVADASAGAAAAGDSSAQTAAQDFLNHTQARLADSGPTRAQLGLCEPQRYCLGYTALFQTVKPRLTDFLLTLIAANDSLAATRRSIADVQGITHAGFTEGLCRTASAAGASLKELRERCRSIWENLGLDRSSGISSCATTDFKDALGSLIEPQRDRRPRIYLTCFEEAAEKYLTPQGAALMRAAVADFLFNYKLSQQYPHEFSPYDLSRSADTLNTALSPVIDAFNRDLAAFQTFMRADVQYHVERLNSDDDQRCCINRLFGLDKPSFFNDGLVTVRTIAGTAASVKTQSQSALDSSSAPALSTLANNIASPASSSGTSPLAAVLGASQAKASLATGVLNSYQSSGAQIGRQLNLQVTPRTLGTASAAEMTVVLSADESAAPGYFGPSGSPQQTTSRVASHDVTTRVRVESVKLFEISSFSAVVERARSRFPLLPPFVEIPYIGTVAGIPIPAAKEYHASTAVVSAMIVPTAADITFGLRFSMDLIVDGDAGPCTWLAGSGAAGAPKPCAFHRAVSTHDFPNAPLRSFHRSIVNCFANGMKTPYTSVASLLAPPRDVCENLTFSSVPSEAP